MIDPLDLPDECMRTGHFVFRVWRKAGGTWNWRLRVEAIDSGDWGIFDTMQDALWFMREHMAIDEDIEADGDKQPGPAEKYGQWLDDLAEPAGNPGD
jgi:hypothetical protein